jgi:hypothetical protein
MTAKITPVFPRLDPEAVERARRCGYELLAKGKGWQLLREDDHLRLEVGTFYGHAIDGVSRRLDASEARTLAHALTAALQVIGTADETSRPVQEGDLIDGGAATIPSNVLEVECAGFLWRRATPDDPAEHRRGGWVAVDGQGGVATDVLLAMAPLQVTRVRTPAPAQAHAGDLIAATAAGISTNVKLIVDSEGDVYRPASGDERFIDPADDPDGDQEGQEYDWVRVGYQVGNTIRFYGGAGARATVEGLLIYAPLRVLEVSDIPTTTQEGPTP